MRVGRKMLRWVAVLAAVVLLAAACGDDGGTDTDSAPPDDSGSSDTSSGDTDDSGDSGDMDSDDMDSDDSGDMDSGDMDSDDLDSDDMDSDDGDSGDIPPGTSLDCAQIQAAVESASDLAAFDPSGSSSSDNLQADFNESRAALAAIGEAAPEISGEVEQALEGLDVIGAAFAELDWNTDFSTNPTAALQLAATFGDADVIGMIGAMTAISAWIASSCTS